MDRITEILNELIAKDKYNYQRIPIGTVNEIFELGIGSFLTNAFLNFPESFVHRMLVATPSLWQQLSVNSWEALMKNLGENEIAIYSLISFLSKYKKINGVELFKNIVINEQTKSEVLKYFSERPGLLIINEFEKSILMSNGIDLTN
jgi:hypothetical protein